MVFWRGRKTVSKNIGKMDRLVTGLIITWAAASIIGFSRTKKGKKMSERIFGNAEIYAKTSLNIFWKITVKILSLFHKK